MRKVILGAGLGGLSAAHYLKKFPNENVILLESSNRVGGWIKSINHQGVIFEQGPRSIRPRGLAGANTLELVEELGLGDQIISIPSTHPAAQNRMIYAKGQLHSLPSNFMSIFKKHPLFSKPLYTYMLSYVTKPIEHIPEGDESLYTFVQRRFGDDIADYAISPLICGICAGDAKNISVRFLMEELFEIEQKSKWNIMTGLVKSGFSRKNKNIPNNKLYKKAKKEKWSIYTFQEGMEMLPKALENCIKKNDDILFNTTCEKLEIYGKNAVLTLNNEKQITTDGIISSLPASELANLMKDEHLQLARLLNAIPFVTVVVLNLKYDKEMPLRKGFGFLVPPKENIPILGVIFDSCCFPHASGGTTCVTVMMGGQWFDKYFGQIYHEKHILDTGLEQMEKILNVTEKPSFYRASILKNCLPQYTVGHKGRIKQIQDYLRANHLPIYLCGSSYYGVGINDVILSAKEAVKEMKGPLLKF